MTAPKTGVEWTALAVRMQRGANAAEALLGAGAKMVRAYCRRRDYCARKARELGAYPWGFISEAVTLDRQAQFAHLFETRTIQ